MGWKARCIQTPGLRPQAQTTIPRIWTLALLWIGIGLLSFPNRRTVTLSARISIKTDWENYSPAQFGTTIWPLETAATALMCRRMGGFMKARSARGIDD